MEKKLETSAGGTTTESKLSYEDLNKAAQSMHAHIEALNKEKRQLSEALQEANLFNLFKRLDYLFNVINNDSSYLTADFKIKCGEEIEELMKAPVDSAGTDKEE